METANFLIPKEDTPNWFEYPTSFLKIIDNELTNLTPWYILSSELLIWRFEGLKERYPHLSLVPFARRGDNDDVACWEKSNSENVIIIHDFASSGWEKRESFEDFWQWFKVAIDDMIEFE